MFRRTRRVGFAALTLSCFVATDAQMTDHLLKNMPHMLSKDALELSMPSNAHKIPRFAPLQGDIDILRRHLVSRNANAHGRIQNLSTCENLPCYGRQPRPDPAFFEAGSEAVNNLWTKCLDPAHNVFPYQFEVEFNDFETTSIHFCSRLQSLETIKSINLDQEENKMIILCK